jgi:hypothetical protein
VVFTRDINFFIAKKLHRNQSTIGLGRTCSVTARPLGNETMSDNWNSQRLDAASAVKLGVGAASNGIYSAINFVAHNDGYVVSGEPINTLCFAGTMPLKRPV